MSALAWRLLPRTSVSGPAGWAPTETIEVGHQDGDAVVRIESWPVTAGVDLDAVAASHPHFGDGLPAWDDRGVVPAVVLGRPDGRRREVSWRSADGTLLVAAISYQLDRGRVVAITAVAPEGAADKAAGARAIIDSITTGSPIDLDLHADLPLRQDDVAEGSWPRWLVDAESASGHEDALLVTVEEALAAGRHFQTAAMPGADPGALASLDPTQLSLALAVAWRGLMARGVESPGSLREALEIGASHDLLLTVSDGEGSTEWFAVRPDRLVRVRRTGDELLALSVHETSALPALAAAAVGATRADCTVRVLYRRGSVIAGDEITMRPQDDRANLADRIMSLLPGARAGEPRS